MTIFIDAETGVRYEIHHSTPEWHAILDWCRAHGIDPNLVHAGSAVVRDSAKHTITYTAFTVTEDGKRLCVIEDDVVSYRKHQVVEQGEAGPLPFPEIVTSGARA